MLNFIGLTLIVLPFLSRFASEKIYTVFTDYSHDKVTENVPHVYLIIILKSYILSK